MSMVCSIIVVHDGRPHCWVTAPTSNSLDATSPLLPSKKLSSTCGHASGHIGRCMDARSEAVVRPPYRTIPSHDASSAPTSA